MSLVCEHAEYDIESMRLLYWRGFSYAGEWELGKGEQSDLKKEELANQKEEMALQKQTIANQEKMLGPVREGLGKYLSGDIGYTPEQMALLNSQFLNKQSQGFNEAQGQVFNALRSRGFIGGDMPATGDAAKYLASLYGLNAATTSSGLTDISLQNIQQALTNKFNAAGIFAGVGGNYGSQSVGLGSNAVGFGGVAEKAGEGRPGFFENLGNAFAKGIGEGFGGSFGKIAGTSAGQGLFGSNSSSGSCWIAEVIYGVDDLRTHILRYWLNEVWAKESFLGKWTMKLYAKYGRKVAKYPKICRMLKPLFDMALVSACEDERSWAS